ncbi:flavin-containing monooxygenase [Gordonia sp. VNK21]|uniref:flavin-containing monooxygenase n=1 Tax=Gordonia sp. VNK21 TaxID=3382483 RepID=UPI0038D40079
MKQNPTVHEANLDRRLIMDTDAAHRAVAAADLRALLMMVFHHTGDRYWLSERFRPVNDIRLIAPEDAGLAEDVQHEIRNAALRVLTEDSVPAITVPDDDTLVEMMSIAIGRRVPPEYAPMMAEQMGFVPLLRSAPQPGELGHATDGVLPVLVVGAGESGMAMAAMLDGLGIDHRVVDSGDTVGGTWRDTRYPGCAVDTPNHSYSFSFGRRYPWPRFFSARQEIQDYLERTADQLGLRESVSFNTRFVSGRWLDDAQCWSIELSHNGGTEQVQARFLITAIGPFGQPQVPSIPGAARFAGQAFHSAHWPAELDVTGKRVAIIGTGASCMQIAPTIADSVAELTILQRTPQWVRPIPRFHELIGDDVKSLLTDEPFYSAWYRFTMMWRYGDGLLATLQKDPSWPHPDRSLNRVNDKHRQEMTAHIVEQLGDRVDLIGKCVPDYPPYGKRILLDNGWYEALTKPNVDLVVEGIAEIEADGIRLADGSLVECEVIVYATGYDVSKNASQLEIVGRQGTTLADRWSDGTGAYLGITVPSFPNLLILQGPTTGLGHGGSAFFTSEVQARYAAQLIGEVLAAGIDSIEVKPDRHDDYLERVDARHAELVWTHPGMVPYYRNEFGKIRTVMPWRLVDYFHMTKEPSLDDFIERTRD